MADYPDSAAHLEKILAGNMEVRRLVLEDEDGVQELTIPYTTTLYTTDDAQLYQGGQQGENTFAVRIR